MNARQRVFREIAEAYGTPWSRRTKLQRRATTNGLCHAYETIAGERAYWDDFKRIFRATVKGDDLDWAGYFTGLVWSRGNGGWLYPSLYESDSIRCLFALLLSQLTDEEVGV